jgi:hypothetical protein
MEVSTHLEKVINLSCDHQIICVLELSFNNRIIVYYYFKLSVSLNMMLDIS